MYSVWLLQCSFFFQTIVWEIQNINEFENTNPKKGNGRKEREESKESPEFARAAHGFKIILQEISLFFGFL